ncbi:hypothetical protein LK09_03865 [Microbacterium mangrovi]|uniref:CsbD-like domain-containing protein n=1 Tax=Microbacterium mangrovi TaxID=1348253 RepID=A0A0B2ABZ6_9MICO|nr:CsbD family protein [Microbacterium mangrovi]KHK99156.1 hypothetical protein LK09_03865 [Microbacterium mangrovi]
MSAEDKAKAAKETVEGKAKEAAGRVTNNPDLVDEGRAHQAKAKGYQARGHVKDAANDVKNAFDNDK